MRNKRFEFDEEEKFIPRKGDILVLLPEERMELYVSHVEEGTTWAVLLETPFTMIEIPEEDYDKYRRAI